MRSFVVPDFADQAKCEGECQQLTPELVGPELHQVVKNPATYAKYRASLTVFDSTGIALEDLAALEVTAEFASEYGVGERTVLSSAGTDPLNPYEFLSVCENDHSSKEELWNEVLERREQL